MKEATLCFVRFGDKILMINRDKPPFMGMWNALGGKRKDGESIENCAIREVEEECGIRLNNPKLLSRFTWNYDDEVGYAYLFELKTVENKFPLKTDEGIVEFKDIEWILSEKNYGVIPDLKVFVADVLKGESKNYHLVYDGNVLKEVIVK